MQKPSTRNWSQIIRVMYATTALCGSIGFHMLGELPVRAESVESATRWMNTREAKEAEIDTHLRATDKDVQDLNGQINKIIGFGSGISGTLLGLQVLGFIASKKG